MNKKQKILIASTIFIGSILGSILLYTSSEPRISFGSIATGWYATSTTQGWIMPTLINGVNPSIQVGTTTDSHIGNLGGVLDASTFPGVDMGAKINAAYAALPADGGKIFVPSGTYTFTTPIVFGTHYKIVKLSCSSAGGSYSDGGTALYYTPTTGSAISFDTQEYVVSGTGIDNCTIKGSNGSSAVTSIGVNIGGNNGGFAIELNNVHVRGFGTGVYYGKNTSFDLITNSTISFNGRNIFHDGVCTLPGGGCGASGENMRVVNSVLNDGNYQGAPSTQSTARYCVWIQLSGNVQWQFTNNSFDDCEVYIDQSGGTANVTHFIGNHFENPAASTASYLPYNFITTLSNVPATEVVSIGNDYMNDANDTTGHKPLQMVSSGGDFVSIGDTVNTNSDVSTSTVRFVQVLNATNVDTISWKGLTSNGGLSSKGVTYVHGTLPYSPEGYSTGLGTVFNITAANSSTNSTTTIQNLGGVYDATTFAGSDIGAQINAAYAALPAKGGVITVPRGTFSFSTPIVFGTNGKRAMLQGAPANGTILSYTGTATSTKINSGIQASGISHTSGCGIRDIKFQGNSYATSSSPKIGIEVGGTNGSDCTVLENVDIFGFGYGLWTSANLYNFNYQGGTIRDNGQNVHLAPASNSGEEIRFTNAFIVDGANTNPFSCFFADDYSAVSLVLTAVSLDDCQLKAGLQVEISMFAPHLENPGQATWGKYTFIDIGNSSYSNLSIFGGTFMNDATTNTPDEFIKTGGYVSLVGVTFFDNGTVVPNAVTQLGTGIVTWSGLQNTGGGSITNVLTGTAFTPNGTTGRTIMTVSPTNTLGLGALEISDGAARAFQLRQNTSFDLNLDTEYAAAWGTAFTVSRQLRYMGIGSTTPTSQLSVGSTNTGTFSISTSTNGCAQFTSGLLWITGSACGSGSGTSAFEIATSSSLALSQVAYVSNVSGRTTLASVATSSIASGTNITVTNGSTAYVLGSQPTINLSGTIPVTLGGTGQISTYPANSIIVSNSAGTALIATTSNNFTIGSFIATSTTLNSYSLNNNIAFGTSTSNYLVTIASSTAPQLALSAGTGIAQWALRNAGGNFYLGTTTVAGTATTSTSALTILGSNGLVGIASSTPLGLLSINPNALGSGVPEFVIGSSSATHFVVTGAGNVGIGYLNPGGPLQVSSASSETALLGASAGNLSNAAINFSPASDNIVRWGIRLTTTLRNLSFDVRDNGGSPLSAMTLVRPTATNLVGSVGIASTTPWGQFSINANTLGSGVPEFVIGSSTKTHFLVNGAGNVGIGTTTPWAILSVEGKVALNGLTTSGAAQTGYICYSVGGELIQDSAVCLVSARKFKKDIKELTVGLDDLMKMTPVSYYKKDPLSKEDSHKQMGFIADDTPNNLKEMLVTYDSNGDVHGFRYEQFTALLAQSIQDLNKKVDGITGETKKSFTDNWQWLVMGLLVVWNMYLTFRERND